MALLAMEVEVVAGVLLGFGRRCSGREENEGGEIRMAGVRDMPTLVVIKVLEVVLVTNPTVANNS